MSTPVTLQDVQSLMATQDDANVGRHKEVLKRFDGVDRRVLRVEDRVRLIEIDDAESRPIMRGIKTAAVLLFTGLVGGYIGGVFGGG